MLSCIYLLLLAATCTVLYTYYNYCFPFVRLIICIIITVYACTCISNFYCEKKIFCDVQTSKDENELKRKLFTFDYCWLLLVVLAALFDLLVKMVSEPLSDADSKVSSQLISLASSCMLSLVIALGETDKLLAAISALITGPPEVANSSLQVHQWTHSNTLTFINSVLWCDMVNYTMYIDHTVFTCINIHVLCCVNTHKYIIIYHFDFRYQPSFGHCKLLSRRYCWVH